MADITFAGPAPTLNYTAHEVMWESASHSERAVYLAVDAIMAELTWDQWDAEDLAVTIAGLFDHRFNALVVETVEALRVSN